MNLLIVDQSKATQGENSLYRYLSWVTQKQFNPSTIAASTPSRGAATRVVGPRHPPCVMAHAAPRGRGPALSRIRGSG